MNFIDIHNHGAWNIDDGMPSMEDAIVSLNEASKDGITTIILTPHFVPGQCTRAKHVKMSKRMDDYIALAKQYNINALKGAEIFLNFEYLELVDNHLFHTLGDSNYILVEFDVRKDINLNKDVEDYLYELIIRNYRPIIAHVERYFHSSLDIKRVRSWIEMGCFLQVNRTSLLGLHGKLNKEVASILLRNALVHVVATDTHRSSGTRICKLSDVYEQLVRIYGLENANLLCGENQQRILNDEKLEMMKVKKKNSIFRKIIGRG